MSLLACTLLLVTIGAVLFLSALSFGITQAEMRITPESIGLSHRLRQAECIASCLFILAVASAASTLATSGLVLPNIQWMARWVICLVLVALTSYGLSLRSEEHT